MNKDNSTLPDVPKFRTRSAMSGSSSENAANRNPYSTPRRKPLYPEPQGNHSDVISWISKSDNPLVKRPPSATGSPHKRNPSSSRMKAGNDTQVKTNQEYVPSNYENPSSASVSKKLLSSSKQTLHNKLRPSSRTSVKSNASLHGDDNHDSYHHGDDIRHGETDEDSLLNDPADTCNTGNNIMLPNDSSKLKTPELSSDMLNALADTVAERLKVTLQPIIGHKQGQRNVSDDGESGIASHPL